MIWSDFSTMNISTGDSFKTNGVDETLKRDVIAFELSFKSSLNENLNELTKRTARYEISHVNALRAKGCRVIGSSD